MAADGMPHEDDSTVNGLHKGQVVLHLISQREQLSTVLVLCAMPNVAVAQLPGGSCQWGTQRSVVCCKRWGRIAYDLLPRGACESCTAG